MGFKFNNSEFTVTDKNGNLKFSADTKMPAILYNISGTISILKILAESPSAALVERTDEFILINNNVINNQNYFILPYFKINGGISDSAQTTICGGGSLALRIIRQPSTGLYLGSSILSTIVESNTLKIQIKHSLDRTGFTNITGDDIINISYRIFYGRFS